MSGGKLYGRRAPRRTARNFILCRVLDGTEVRGRLIDVSAGGLAAQLDEPVPSKQSAAQLMVELHESAVFIDANVVSVSGDRRVIHCAYSKRKDPGYGLSPKPSWTSTRLISYRIGNPSHGNRSFPL